MDKEPKAETKTHLQRGTDPDLSAWTTRKNPASQGVIAKWSE